jgi:hypothetical protein
MIRFDRIFLADALYGWLKDAQVTTRHRWRDRRQIISRSQRHSGFV